ncbi:hypothetical protein [Photorhabdus laumondii]|uniref:hypothetical protein n=1 Tax=Photorhabdus laumondii TaxID=2218628 RepID=UPI0002D3DFBE|nr:hypothetical protein [Photorhabdus laumondii]
MVSAYRISANNSWQPYFPRYLYLPIKNTVRNRAFLFTLSYQKMATKVGVLGGFMI